MKPSWFSRLLTKMFRPGRRTSPPGRLPRLEALSERILPAVTATFTPSQGVLTVLGDNLDNTIALSRNAAGRILVNGGAVAVKGGNPTVANVTLIQVSGQGGNDAVTMDEANGTLP